MDGEARSRSPAGRTKIERMLEARSVAVVGASIREGSLGRQVILELERGGFAGGVFPVNPRYEEVLGRPCYPSISDVPDEVDLAVLAVANERVEAAIGEAAAAGAGSVVTFSSLHEDAPPQAGLPPLADRVAGIARSAGMALCGGNGMGFIHLETGLRATGFATPDDLAAGPVTLISHSGSAFTALAFNDRGLGFNLLVSSGQEIVTTMADYMTYALSLPTTRILALLLETVRDADGFLAALASAAERGVAVVALKMGRTESTQPMIMAHSGALAGEHGAYEAVFESFGVHEVTTLDELADTLALFSSPRRVSGGTGIATVHDSGGERAMLADIAEDVGVPFAEISSATRDRIAGVLDPGLEAANPLDAWGTGIDAPAIFRESLAAFADDPATAAIAFCVDVSGPHDEEYFRLAREMFPLIRQPFCVLSNLASARSRDQVARLRHDGIPVLEGTWTGLRALRHLMDDGSFRRRPPVEAPDPVSDDVRERWREELGRGIELGESSALGLLADYGIATTGSEVAGSLDEAIAVAARIGYPVVAKTAMPGTLHKTERGGVRLGIEDERALADAYGDLAEHLGSVVSIAAMAPVGVEVALGIVCDPTFGPLVLVAAGGVLVELLADRRLAMPPVDATRAASLIDGLRARPLLDGARGAPPADVGALAAAIARLSVLASDLGDLIEALDVNPVICSPGGCVAVDGLLVPRRC